MGAIPFLYQTNWKMNKVKSLLMRIFLFHLIWFIMPKEPSRLGRMKLSQRKIFSWMGNWQQVITWLSPQIMTSPMTVRKKTTVSPRQMEIWPFPPKVTWLTARNWNPKGHLHSMPKISPIKKAVKSMAEKFTLHLKLWPTVACLVQITQTKSPQIYYRI